MANETKHVQFGEAKQKQLDDVVRKLAHEQGPLVAVEAELDRRLSYREEGKVQWGAYARFLLSNGHTVYVNLRTMEGSVSKTPDKYAQAKVEKRAERKAKAEAKAAEAKATKAEPKVEKVKAKTVKGGKVPKDYDPAAEVLNSMAGVTKSSAKHNSRKAAKKVNVNAEVDHVTA
jgi:hypothetical protein